MFVQLRLFVCLSVCPSVCLSVRLPVCLSVCLSVYPSFCLCVCLSCSSSNFWVPWPTNFVFGTQVHLCQYIYVKIEYHVIGSRSRSHQWNGQTTVTKCTHRWVVCLRSKVECFECYEPLVRPDEGVNSICSCSEHGKL